MALLDNVRPAALESALPVRPPPQGVCGACAMNPWCYPDPAAPASPGVVERRRRLAPGEALFAAGAPRQAIHAVRAGYLKATVADGAGGEHIVRFLLPGDVAGLDSLATGVHQSGAVAVGDCEVCEIAAWALEPALAAGALPGRHLRGLVARDLARAQAHAAALARLTAIQRVALLLRELSQRWLERGYSGSAYGLPMGRREIGEHLGLTMETVSRILSRMRARGWIRLSRGGVEIVRPDELARVLGAASA